MLWRPNIDTDPRERQLDVQLPLVLGTGVCAAILAGKWLGSNSGVLGLSAILGLWGLVYFGFSGRPLRFAVGLGTLFAASLLLATTQQSQLAIERSFFGVSRVVIDASHRYRLLMHGSIIHGMQSLDPARSREPLSYFSISGPIGQLFAAFDGNLSKRRVAVVGLGAGSLACYSKLDQHWTFYEIDLTVVRLARDPHYFTFLRDCAPNADIVLGDARLSLEKAADARYDLIILDAYSSDAIPVHLITREALAIYRERLSPHGVLAFHVSNKFFDLKLVLGNLAHDAGLTALVQDHATITEEEGKEGKYRSTWVVLARSPEDLSPLRGDVRWQVLGPRPELPIWTDNFSSILSVLR
jgi:spermidine synthase